MRNFDTNNHFPLCVVCLLPSEHKDADAGFRRVIGHHDRALFSKLSIKTTSGPSNPDGGWWGGGGSYRLPLEDQGLPQTFYCMNTQHGNLGEGLRRPSLVQRDRVMVWVMGRWECALWEVMVGRREEEEEEERRASFRLGGGEMCASLI